MVGTILLTHRVRSGVRKQSIANQNARTKATSVEIRKIPSGGGI
jgi:NADH-quinone oxidoreductase subunit J